MGPIQIALIVLITLILIGMIAALVVGQEKQKKKQALSIIRGSSYSSKKSNPQDEQNKRRAEIAKKLKDSKDGNADPSGKKITMSLRLARAGLSIKPVHFWLLSVLSCVTGLGLGKLMAVSPFVLVMMGIIFLLGLPRFVLKRITSRRQTKFLKEFPDALDAVVRLLKAGMPVSEAISMISKEFDGPVGEEMTYVYDKQKIGIPLHEAAYEATRNMPLTEMQMFATGLAIQAQTGSSLSEVLSNLSNVIRARFRLKRKVRALSSEAIASASIIGSLPPLIMLGIWFIRPEYIGVLFTDRVGQYWLGGAICSMLVGCIVMKVMINFKI